MNIQPTIIASRLAAIKMMRDENTRLKVENARLKAENEMLNSHFDFALTAAADLSALEEGGRFLILDGWNILLGDDKVRWRKELGEFGVFWQSCGSMKLLCEKIESFLAGHPKDYIWLLMDGERENVVVKNRYRISYTGGIGPQRADRMIVDFVRMAHFRDDPKKIVVVTGDKRLQIEVKRAANFQNAAI